MAAGVGPSMAVNQSDASPTPTVRSLTCCVCGALDQSAHIYLDFFPIKNVYTEHTATELVQKLEKSLGIVCPEDVEAVICKPCVKLVNELDRDEAFLLAQFEDLQMDGQQGEFLRVQRESLVATSVPSRSKKSLFGREFACCDCKEGFQTLNEALDHHRDVHDRVPKIVDTSEDQEQSSLCPICGRQVESSFALEGHLEDHDRSLLDDSLDEQDSADGGETLDDIRLSLPDPLVEPVPLPLISPTLPVAGNSVSFSPIKGVFASSPRGTKSKAARRVTFMVPEPEELKQETEVIGIRKGEKLVCKFCTHSPADEEELKGHVTQQHMCYDCQELIPKGQKKNHRKICRMASSGPRPRRRSRRPVKKLPKTISVEDAKRLDKVDFQFCPTCCRRLKNMVALQRHIREVHEKPRPFVCQECGSRFTTNGKLDDHVLAVHSENSPFQCWICGKKLSNASSLKKHEDLHIGRATKPHACQFCPKRFQGIDNLNVHLRVVHPNREDFLYICDVCHRKFPTLSWLKGHLRSHSDIRPHQCSYCDARFKTSFQRRLHMRIHTGEKPYECSLCSCKFSFQASLSAHLVRKHGLESKDIAYVSVAEPDGTEAMQVSLPFISHAETSDGGSVKILEVSESIALHHPQQQ